MRTVADARLLRERLSDGTVKSVTVIGGSMVGIKIVELCQEAGLACTLADMAERIFPLAAFPDVSAEIERRLTQKGVKLRFGSAVTSAEEMADHVTTVFADGEPVVSDLLVLCIGTRARTALAREAGLEVGRGIVVNDSMETSAPGVYAAGDCCEGRNIMTGGHQIIGLWANAAYQGQTAGHCMAGDPTVFSGNILHNITHFMGMDFISFGDVQRHRRSTHHRQTHRHPLCEGSGLRRRNPLHQPVGQLPHQRRHQELHHEPLYRQQGAAPRRSAGAAGPRRLYRRISDTF